MCNYKVVKGDLLNTNAQVIIHQTNCQGAFGSGVAAAVRNRYPIVYDKYMYACKVNSDGGNVSSAMLGKIQTVRVNERQIIVNMFAQDNYGADGKRYTSYDALDSCLRKVREYCEKNNLTTIALPYNMSSDRGGAEWDAVVAIIKGVFRTSKIDIEIRKL